MVLTNSLVRLAVLGSTGSIGKQTLDIVRVFPDKFKIISLSAGHNLSLLKKQIAEFKPEFVYYQGDREKLPAGIKFTMPEEMAVHPDTDVVVNAISVLAKIFIHCQCIQKG